MSCANHTCQRQGCHNQVHHRRPICKSHDVRLLCRFEDLETGIRCHKRHQAGKGRNKYCYKHAELLDAMEGYPQRAQDGVAGRWAVRIALEQSNLGYWLAVLCMALLQALCEPRSELRLNHRPVHPTGSLQSVTSYDSLFSPRVVSD